MSAPKEQISIVLPCLNEEHTLGLCIEEIHTVCRTHHLNYEIVVADNGCTDNSPQIAREMGARVERVQRRGYGSAVHGGICAAKGDIVVMADCDFSYPFSAIPDLIAPIVANQADIVLGNRLNKDMQKGAMPSANHYIGTPMLSALIRWLYKIPVYDCNGGMRAIRRSIYPKLTLKQPGMEYASEMLLRAGQEQIRYTEVPIAFRKHAKGHTPYLNPLRDGLRHLWTIVKGSALARNVCLVGALMLLGGLYSISLGQNGHWDLLNYHLYNGFAALHGRFGVDVFPAALHTTFNPLLDAIYYLVFVLFSDFPHVMAFVLGLPYGILLWVTYYLMKEIFSEVPAHYRNYFIWGGVFIGCTSAGVVSQVGGATNEIYLDILKVWSLLLAIRFIKKPSKTSLIYGAAFILGMAGGFKTSLLHNCVALLALFIFQWKRLAHPWRSLLYFAAAGIAGFVLIDGYFMWVRWHVYQNPFFPLLNNVFHSPYLDPISLMDRRILPHKPIEWIFFPFYWAFEPIRQYAAETWLRDPRLAICFILLPLSYLRSIKALRQKYISDQLFNSLAVYACIGYSVWLGAYGILRYAGMLEILTGILIVLFCGMVGKKEWKICLILLAAQGLWLFSVIPDWDHHPYVHNIFKVTTLGRVRITEQEVLQRWKRLIFKESPINFLDHILLFKPHEKSLPHVEDNSLVFTMLLGTSYLLPQLNPKAQFMGGYWHNPDDYPDIYRAIIKDRLNYAFPQDFFQHHFEDLQRTKIAAHKGPIYILSYDWPMITHAPVLDKFGLQGKWEDCRTFQTYFYKTALPLALCRVYKKEKTK